ncbi:uncharacterized protein [Coffea arabica]|uniref:Endonuclease/exonuclease/phosphatase domain-containing protein n=1 Tax=Coffea arabica TaxID=13443 RepID=A0A6P6UZZ6_COFAR|nr:uncharacterized protein LOC113715925 [Coffea arabica]
MAAFRDALNEANLYDLGFKGSSYTWARGRNPNHRICERLDRAVASPEWCSLFPAATVSHLSSSWSDHAPIRIAIKCSSKPSNDKRRRRQSYKIEQIWISDEECEKILSENWHGVGVGDPVTSLASCSQKALYALNSWGRRKFGNLKAKIRKLSDKLQAIQFHSCSQIADDIHIRKELDSLLE